MTHGVAFGIGEVRLHGVDTEARDVIGARPTRRLTPDDVVGADIDIDEASGIEHGFEVIRNAVTKGKTNPYQIHELLLLTEIDPGYELVLR